ncbi:MAG TPA: ATP-binding protein [Thermoleophilia bacterium]|nr:ATP-binding protein [Thermoleophilia bacterium]
MPKRSEPKASHAPADECGQRIGQHLARLGLAGLDVEAHLTWAREHHATDREAVERLFAQAVSIKRERSIEWRIKGSGLKVRKTLAAFDWAFQPKLDRRAVEDLFSLSFLDRREDILVTGKSGTGKSHILQALAIKTCEREVTVRYARCVDLVDDLYAGLADGSYERRMRRWCRPSLLVIDDVGLGQLKRRDEEATAAHLLFTLLDRRHMNVSTALTSNIKLSAWGKYLGDATLAAAVLDRLAATSTRLDIDGPSYRQFLARKRAQEHGLPLPAEREGDEP